MSASASLMREENAAKGRAWRASNVEKSRAIVASYRLRNLDRERERRRKYMARVRSENPEIHKEKQNTWFRTNRDKTRTYEAKQRAVRKGAVGSYTAKDVQIILETQRNLCFYCNDPLNERHEEHFIPLSKGGSNYRCNIVLACANCNLRKGNKAPIEFLNWKMKTPTFWHERTQTNGSTAI